MLFIWFVVAMILIATGVVAGKGAIRERLQNGAIAAGAYSVTCILAIV